MRTPRTAKLATLAFLIVTMISTLAVGQDFSFKPFSDVTNVCPSCEVPESDVVHLKNSAEIHGQVVAQNDLFYTIVRFGEVRTIPLQDVQSISWQNGTKPVGIDSVDQIVIKNGHVLTGKIVVENEEPEFYQIQSSYMEQTYTVFKSQVVDVFRAGNRQ